MKWTAADVVQALREAYGVTTSNLVTDEWSLLTEVPLRTGRNKWSGNERRIDVLLVRNWTSGVGHRRVAIEVKVSRADFRSETVLKRQPAEAACHQTVYAAPAGIIPVEELPTGWGLIEVHETAEAARASVGRVVGGDNRTGRCTWRRKADVREALTDEYLVSAVARQASRLAEVLRRGETAAAEVATLQAEVDRLTGQLARRQSALYREQQRVSEVRRLLAAADGMQECADCGQPITYRLTRYEWKHTRKVDEEACLRARQEAAARAREAATGTAYLRGYAGRVEPVAVRQQRESEDAAALSGVHSDHDL